MQSCRTGLWIPDAGLADHHIRSCVRRLAACMYAPPMPAGGNKWMRQGKSRNSPAALIAFPLFMLLELCAVPVELEAVAVAELCDGWPETGA